MAKKLTLLLLPCLLLAAALAADTKRAAHPGGSAAATIRPEALRAHIRFLSDDLLEGRGTGTRGYDLAARYVASQFEQFGLAPGGKDGTYYQPVPLLRLDVDPEQCSVTLKRSGREQTLKYAEDYLMWGNESAPDADIEAPLVFVGFGVTAPEQGYDDYAGVDAKGKIVVVLYGAPASFPSTVRAHYSSNVVKSATAVARGAVGFILLRTPEFEKSAPWAWVVRQAKMPWFRWLDPAGVPNDARPQLRGRAGMNRSGAEALFAGAARSLDEVFAAAEKGKPGSVELVGSAKLRTVSRHSRIESPNVAGLLRGADPKLKDEYLVYTAHLDHLGVGEAVQGQTVYHGALDNASGTAVMLEVARAFSMLKKRPRRSILFVAVTAEEKGLLGSDYFAHHPTVPQRQIVANLNMDGAAILYPFRDVVALGAEHSSLGAVAQEEAARMNVKLSPDPQPEEVFFVRSDQYSFVKQGIPAMDLFPGVETGDPKRTGTQVLKQWMGTRYHTPQDEFDQPFDYEAAAQYSQLNFAVGYRVAQATPRPQWKPGDFFGRMFSRSSAASSD